MARLVCLAAGLAASSVATAGIPYPLSQRLGFIVLVGSFIGWCVHQLWVEVTQ